MNNPSGIFDPTSTYTRLQGLQTTALNASRGKNYFLQTHLQANPTYKETPQKNHAVHLETTVAYRWEVWACQKKTHHTTGMRS